jgi:hypothetical protein
VLRAEFPVREPVREVAAVWEARVREGVPRRRGVRGVPASGEAYVPVREESVPGDAV